MALEDTEAVHAFKSDPVATRMFGEAPHVDVDQTQRWVLEGIEGNRDGRCKVWAITLPQNGQAIGECCLWNIDHEMKHAELGFELLRSCWKRGLMNEALTAVIDHGFGEMGLHRIEASPLSGNMPSQRVLVRLGFRLEGTFRQRHLHEGVWHDEMWFGLLRSEWATGAD
jgi:RimJ/RimL family protein N-acetyltransferase